MDQLGFAESFLGPEIGRNRRLERIDALLDWASVGRRLTAELEAGDGRPPYPPLAMFKALLLQQWYGLSDPGLEEALLDRLSFRRFCGLPLDGTTPDETTLCRFRGRLKTADLGDVLFQEVSRQLEARGFLLKTGTLIDATLVAASVRPPQNRPAEQTTPGEHSVNPLDPDANWTRSGAKRHLFFGYKAHIGVDQGSGLIRSREMTPAKTYESEVADGLICGDERAVYADKAYDKKARREALKARGVKDRIMHRRNKHHDLTRWQKLRNKLIRTRRAPIENVFGTWKRLYGFARARYRGLAANALHLDLLAIAFNLRRAERLA
jgi:IS5 family transposase